MLVVVPMTASLQYADRCEGTYPEPENVCVRLAEDVEHAQELVDDESDPVIFVVIYVLGNYACTCCAALICGSTM